MKNHFHFLIRVRTIEEQKQFFESFSLNSSTEGPIWLPHGYNNEKFKVQTPSRQFSHLFNKYSRNFNKWANRTGKLFEQPFKRKVITDESYLIHLICYIHRNPIHHKITDTFEAYPYSSFKTFLSGTPTFLGVKKVLNWFQGKKGFIAAHKEMKLKITPEMTLE
ncbi:MAG TPA: hypothetical protein VF181_03265 [Balneolaceae bacterium]